MNDAQNLTSTERQAQGWEEVRSGLNLRGKRAAVVLFSHYPSDPRPRRAAEALVQEGMEVDVISLKQNPEEASRETFGGVRILRIPLQRSRGGKLAYIFQYASFILAAFGVLTFRSWTRRYRLVHVHNMPDVLVFSALVPKLVGAKVILDQHDPMPELMMTIFGFGPGSRAVGLMRRLEKWSLRFANAVLTVNIACLKIFSGRSCAIEKVRVVMNAPDESIFQFRELGAEAPSVRDPSKPFVMMYHGSLVERHGLDIAVAALKKIRPTIPTAELHVYGRSTPFLEEVMGTVREQGLTDAVHCLGGKKLEEIAQAIRQCDVGIIPNRRSIFTEINTPTRIFEYLSQGKPVIAPASAGIQDYFGPEELVYFELGEAEDLARKMEYVYWHPAEVDRITRRGQEIYGRHKWSCERARFLNLVGDLLGAGAGPKLKRDGRDYAAMEVTYDRRGSSID